jgi:hypothetical protein
MALNVTRNELDAIVEMEEPDCVSILMPTHEAGSEIRQDPIRLKTLTERAEHLLTEVGVARGNARQRLAGLYELVEQVDYWRDQRRGLAFYLSDSGGQSYKIPYPVEELCVVGPGFQITPLLPLAAEDQAFYLLAISQNQVRFFRCTRWSIEEEDLPGAPESLAETLAFDVPEEHLEWHTRAEPAVGAHQRKAMFHGQGVGTDDRKEQRKVLTFCEQVDRAITDRLGQAKAPLVLAAAATLQGLYREANRYEHLLEGGIHGNPDTDQPGSRPEELHRLAVEGLGEDFFRRGRQQAVEAYQGLSATERSAAELESILPAARDAQVQALLVQRGARCWGRFDRSSGEVEHHEEERGGSEDLLNAAARLVLQRGGEAYLLEEEEMPAASPVAAVYRYATTSS